jgi:Leucine-rich repeat (LRR) protein
MSTDGLLRLLRARDPDLVDQGVALAVALGDPQLFDSLLEGVEYGEYSNRSRFRDGDRRWIFVPNALFSGSRSSQPLLDRAMLGLIALAPPESVVATELRRRVHDLWLGGSETDHTSLDLSWVSAFTELRHLNLHHHQPLRGTLCLPSLKVLILHACSLPEALTGLELPALEELVLIGSSTPSLHGLSSLRQLRSLGLHGGGILRLDGLENLPSLQELSLSDIPASPSLVGLKHLRRLSLHALPAPLPSFQNAPSLQELSLSDLPACDLSAVHGLAALESLRVSMEPGGEGLRGLGMSGLPSLRILELEAEDLSDLQGLEQLPALERLELRSQNGVDLSSVARQSSLTQLALVVPELSAIQGLPPKLRQLSICAPALSSLSELPSTLEELYLPGCTSLPELDLSPCGQLSTLSLDGCSSLRVLHGTKHLSKLRTVDLRQARSLREVPALVSARELRAVAIAGCALARHNFPPSLRPVLTADPRVDLEAMGDSPPPLRDARPRDESAFQTFLKRLRIRDLEAIDATVADLRDSLEAFPERLVWFERYLAGTQVVERKSPSSRREERVLEPGPLLKGTRSDVPYREYAVLALIASAPPELLEAKRLRESIHRLRLSGHIRSPRDPDAPLQLAPLLCLTELHTLVVEGAHPLRGAELLASLTLQSLELTVCTGLQLLPPLPSTLRRLRLENLIGLRDCTELSTLTDLEELDLDRLDIQDLRFLSGLPRLKRLRLRHLPMVDSLESLASCTALESLELTALGIRSTAGLGRLPRLYRLHLEAHPDLTDISALSTLPLTQLHLSQLYRLRDVRPLTRISSLSQVESEGLGVALPSGFRWSPIARCEPSDV